MRRDNWKQFPRLDSLKDSVHEGILERGELWSVWDDVIHRHLIDLIVLGSHGKHGVKKSVLGSGAEQIFRPASCPVPPWDRNLSRAAVAPFLSSALSSRRTARRDRSARSLCPVARCGE